MAVISYGLYRIFNNQKLCSSRAISFDFLRVPVSVTISTIQDCHTKTRRCLNDMSWQSLPVVFIYATHKENKSEKQDTVFHSVYKEDIVYLLIFTPHYRRKKL